MILVKGNALKFARVKRGQLQRELAKEIGIASNTYACIERGSRSPNPHTARIICSKLGANFDDLFEMKEGVMA